ncbi:MAG TPA: YceI family protein [Dermatophilaceae bacterium]|jgi:polyisoprenoid-binding protein YceI
MTASSLASVEVPRPGTYRIDPQRSTVSYSGRHMFGLGVVHATFAISSGELRVADPSTASTVTVSVDAGSFHSNSAKRDNAVRSATFLDAAAYPEITFASDGLREDGDHWRLTGNVTAHGSTAPVDVLIDQATHEAGAWRVHARAEHLDRYAFGVTKGRGMVGRYLDLDLDVFAVPA